MEGRGQPGSRAWPWGQFLRAAPDISKLLSVFYKSTHRFSKSSFFCPSKGCGDDKAAGGTMMRSELLYVRTCLLYIGYFSVLGSIHRTCVLLCYLLIARRYHFRPFRCLSVFPGLAGSTKDLLQRRYFERSHYSPN